MAGGMTRINTDWFEQLTGFRETNWGGTRSRLAVSNGRLLSRVNRRSYAIGRLETPTLAELRTRAMAATAQLSGKLSLGIASGDVRPMHLEPDNRRALFQVASQFNLLEMAHPRLTPEDGVTCYAADGTQGPACALAAAAATIYRNYFVPVEDQFGQTASRQIDCLADLGAALGNKENRLWKMTNGYALGTKEGLVGIDKRLSGVDSVQLDAWRDLLRIGIHWDVEVTDTAAGAKSSGKPPTVSQAFCSALPVGYSKIPASHWSRFATLVLEGAYEATLWVAALNAARGASNRLYLTSLGGGVFKNDPSWIHAGMRRALRLLQGTALDVRLVSYGEITDEAKQLLAEFR